MVITHKFIIIGLVCYTTNNLGIITGENLVGDLVMACYMFWLAHFVVQ